MLSKACGGCTVSFAEKSLIHLVLPVINSFPPIPTLNSTSLSCLTHPQIYEPVCAVTPDGTERTFSNSCFASCENATVIAEGEC